MQFYHSSPQIHHQRILHYTNNREDDRKLIFFSSLSFVFLIYILTNNLLYKVFSILFSNYVVYYFLFFQLPNYLNCMNFYHCWPIQFLNITLI